MESNSDSVVDAAEKEPEEKGKPSLHYWRSQLDAYDNAAEPWKKDVDKAWDEYTHEEGRGQSQSKKGNTHFPLFWSCVRTIQPAFYSRTPVIVTEKAFKEMKDPAARLAAICYERLGKYLVKTSGFDRAMGISVTHFIMSEKVTNRVVFEASISETQVPSEGNDGQMMLQPEQDIEYMKCEVETWHYKKARHTPNARHDGEIDWMAFDTDLTRTEVEKVFGEEAASQLTFAPLGTGKDKKEVKGLPAHFTTVTEIWDKKKRKVYYLSPGHTEWLINQDNPNGDDPYKLKDFFPCPPFMLGTFGADDMFTVPAYIQLEDFIEQVHGAFDRVRRLILALKKAGVFDASKPELADLNGIASEGQFIGVKDLEALLGPQGSLDKLIHFFPTDKIAKGVNELKSAMVDFEQKMYDLWGIPDIYRGITDPNETLGAQQLKGKHMSVRFSVLQREVQRLARDTIEIMGDLYLGRCPDFKLGEIMGVQHMTPEDAQLFPQALALLKSDKDRCIRIEIETDSTITQNLNADIEQKNYLAKTFFEGIAALKDVNPVFMPVAAKAVELGIKSLQQGKQIEGELEQALEGMVQAASQPAQTPPDPAMIKAQADIQAAQQKAQIDSQLQQQKMQSAMQIESQKAQAQIAVEERQTMADIAREDRRMQAKIASDQAMAQTKMELEMFKAQMAASNDNQKEQMKIQADMQKAELDRQAAEHQSKLDMILAAFQAKVDAVLAEKAQKDTETQEERRESKSSGSSVPAIHIHAAGDGKPRKRKLKITQNEDGSAADIEEILEDAEGA